MTVDENLTTKNVRPSPTTGIAERVSMPRAIAPAGKRTPPDSAPRFAKLKFESVLDTDRRLRADPMCRPLVRGGLRGG